MQMTPASRTAIRIFRTASDAAAVTALLGRSAARNPEVERAAAEIVRRVRRGGDRALRAYARKFDRLDGPMALDAAALRAGARSVPAQVKDAIRLAAANIRAVAAKQVPRTWTISPVPGLRITQRVTPLDRVGCYVPGGRYPLPSSLLMTSIPAVTAGVGEVFAVCPRLDPTVMFAALEAGVTRLFRIGGAHAVAALAYGTESIPRVDKIVGPGNAYVAAAKALVAADCAIDFFAGPSEIAVVSASGNPEWIAADLIAQAEHDPDARAILFTPSARLARAVAEEVAKQLPATGPAAIALKKNGGIVLSPSLRESITLCQRLAPEHVVCDDDEVASRLTRAGTVFVGPLSAQACGDYVTGSNHVLPTSGAAAARGGLSASDFVRVSSVQRISRAALDRIGPAAVALAEAEGLTAHAASVRLRLGVSPGSARGQTGVRPGSDRGQAGVRPGPARGQAGVRPGSGRGQPGVSPGSDRGQAPTGAASEQGRAPRRRRARR
jgi:histidinol dehydrogenase